MDPILETKTDSSVDLPTEARVEQILERLNGLATGKSLWSTSDAMELPAARPVEAATFVPRAPTSLQEARLSESQLEELVLKLLLTRGDLTGRAISQHLKLPFTIIERQLQTFKYDQLISYVGQATMNDYVCRLSDVGRERARRFAQVCTYFGAAPVPLQDYIASVKAQTIEGQYPTPTQLAEAFSDLLINPQMLARLGPAISSGRGIFLYGYPGNGKTSIAERITRSFGPYIWIPRAISVDGEIIRVFDPMCHEEAPLAESGGLINANDVDHRWIRIKRPTIIVGGELTMDHLELTFVPKTGISEAPVQLKSNCGVLVIDDFGRQRMRIDELLNRWIVPLEKRYDMLNLASGKKIEVPFDQLVIFSTNLEPRDLVDDAFMRRIPYKIEVLNPTREEFIRLFEIVAPKMQIPFNRQVIDYLLAKHYEPHDRPLRNCHPRDLLLQIRNYCNYNQLPLQMTKEAMDVAVENYFSML
jgi:predicted ATPase with chaperone activity